MLGVTSLPRVRGPHPTGAFESCAESWGEAKGEVPERREVYLAVALTQPNSTKDSKAISGQFPISRFIVNLTVSCPLSRARAGVHRDLQSIPPGGQWRESFWIEPERPRKSTGA